MAEVERPAIVALATNDWHRPWWQDRQHLLARLAGRGWPVVFSNGPLDLWERDARRWAEAALRGGLERVPVNGGRQVVVEHAGRVWPTWQRWPSWTRFVERRHARRLRRLAGGLRGEGLIAFVCGVRFHEYVDWLRPDWVVLHVFDAWRSERWTAAQDERLARLVRRADRVTAISESMVRGFPVEPGAKLRVIPHGVDERAFADVDTRACPPELACIPRPRIGYFGRVSLKLDLELVATLAERRPDWHWVFVGEVGIGERGAFRHDSPEARAWGRLQSLANVHFLGRREQAELPAYLVHMDVNVMCYKTEGAGYWLSVFPLKLFEYLAAGRPVVASPIENLQPYTDVLELAGTCEAWRAALERAIDAGGVGTVAARRALAAENTWDRRAARLEEELLAMMRERPL